MATTRSDSLPGAREDQIGADLVGWLDFVRRRYPRPIAADDQVLQVLGRDLDEVDLFFHVPNGVWTHPKIAASFVAQGLKTGVVDYVWPLARVVDGVAFATLGLELKRARPKGTRSANQARFQAAVQATTNWKVVTTWGLWEPARVVQRYAGYPADVLDWVPFDRPPGRVDVDPWDGRPIKGV
jgi:hypothetical protein